MESEGRIWYDLSGPGVCHTDSWKFPKFRGLLFGSAYSKGHYMLGVYFGDGNCHMEPWVCAEIKETHLHNFEIADHGALVASRLPGCF